MIMRVGNTFLRIETFASMRVIHIDGSFFLETTDPLSNPLLFPVGDVNDYYEGCIDDMLDYVADGIESNISRKSRYIDLTRILVEVIYGVEKGLGLHK